MNANDIITAALRRLSVVPSGGTPTANQLADGLEVLNDMLNSWSALNATNYQPAIATIPLSAGVAYIDITTTYKPIYIEQVYLIKFNTTERIVLSEMSYEQFAKTDSTQTGVPEWYIFLDDHPTPQMYFDKKADAGYVVGIIGKYYLEEFPDGTTDVDLPRYYERALKTNLAIEIAPEMGAAKRVTSLMMQQAEDAKDVIIGKSVKLQPSVTELSSSGSYNIEGDSY